MNFENDGGYLGKERPCFSTTMRESWYCPVNERHLFKRSETVAFNITVEVERV